MKPKEWITASLTDASLGTPHGWSTCIVDPGAAVQSNCAQQVHHSLSTLPSSEGPALFIAASACSINLRFYGVSELTDLLA
jgi:hypothetical protein